MVYLVCLKSVIKSEELKDYVSEDETVYRFIFRDAEYTETYFLSLAFRCTY